MSRLEDADKIERIVGASRDATAHIARAVSAEQRVYILHSEACRAEHADLRDYSFSRALDRGIEDAEPWRYWRQVQDRPVRVQVWHGYLMPLILATRSAGPAASDVSALVARGLGTAGYRVVPQVAEVGETLTERALILDDGTWIGCMFLDTLFVTSDQVTSSGDPS